MASPIAGSRSIIGTPYAGTHTLYGNWESDNAVDLAAPVGTPIYAVTAGVIGPQFGALDASAPNLAGLRLHLKAKAVEFYYAHLSSFADGIRPGVAVSAGQLLGYSGSANGVGHLHFATSAGTPYSYVPGASLDDVKRGLALAADNLGTSTVPVIGEQKTDPLVPSRAAVAAGARQAASDVAAGFGRGARALAKQVPGLFGLSSAKVEQLLLYSVLLVLGVGLIFAGLLRLTGASPASVVGLAKGAVA